MSNIAIFSGTFDPIHEGHILFAQSVQESYEFDQILFVPNPKPAHKPKLTPVETRIEMIKLALEDQSNMDVLITPEEQGHSVKHTLDFIRKQFPKHEITMLMGADAFEKTPQWDDADELYQKVSFVVALRTDDDGEIVVPLAKSLDIDADFVPAPIRKVASSKIRARIASFEQPIGLNDRVYEFIKDHELYV